MRKILVLILWFLTASTVLTLAQDKQLLIHIHFGSTIPSDLQVVPANLKYDKDFAFSFTFDDGLDDAYSQGYKFLKGGSIAADGITYPGLFSTDGCGSPVPFRAGIAWYTANQYNQDLHNGSPGYMTYSQAIELFHSGWDFFNHSYDHPPITNTVDYLWELTTNRASFKANTGINLNYCVPANGDQAYVEPAFSLGTNACFTSSSESIGFGVGTDVTLPVSSGKPVYWRRLVTTDVDNSASLNLRIDNWVAKTGPGKQKWWNEFTHRVGYVQTGASIVFPDFKVYFEHMEQNYGSNGRDNGWFASSVEVFEYLIVRDNVIIQLQKNGSDLDVILDYSQVPGNFRYYDLSLLIKGAAEVVSVTYEGPMMVSHAPKGNSHLINIDVPDSRFSGIHQSFIESEPQLKGFPNPVKDQYFLKVPANRNNIGVTITNMLSEEMPLPSLSISDGLVTINFNSGYPPGLYYIKVFAGDQLLGFSKILLISR